MVAQLAYVGTKGTHLTAVRDLNQLQPLGNGINPFGPGQPITGSVCQSGANNGGFFVSGLNSIAQRRTNHDSQLFSYRACRSGVHQYVHCLHRKSFLC